MQWCIDSAAAAVDPGPWEPILLLQIPLFSVVFCLESVLVSHPHLALLLNKNEYRFNRFFSILNKGEVSAAQILLSTLSKK